MYIIRLDDIILNLSLFINLSFSSIGNLRYTYFEEVYIYIYICRALEEETCTNLIKLIRNFLFNSTR